jgi:hypothetical protein
MRFILVRVTYILRPFISPIPKRTESSPFFTAITLCHISTSSAILFGSDESAMMVSSPGILYSFITSDMAGFVSHVSYMSSSKSISLPPFRVYIWIKLVGSLVYQKSIPCPANFQSSVMPSTCSKVSKIRPFITPYSQRPYTLHA